MEEENHALIHTQPSFTRQRPLVSVVIPCRNEENYLSNCIQSLLEGNSNDYDIELVIVDGNSTDNSTKVIRQWQDKYSNIKLVSNPRQYTPFGLNLGVKNASGEYVLIASSHSAFAPNYISVLLKAREELQADIVGGVMQTDLLHKTPKSLAIKDVLSCRFGVGNALFRTGVTEPKAVDTVPFGLYKKSLFEEVGYYNEKLIRNHDMELSKRMLAAGKKIFLIPDAHCTYYARENYTALLRNNFRNGLWNLLTVRITGKLSSLSLRHFIPLLFILGIVLPAIIGIFFHPLLYFSLFVIVLYLGFVTSVSIDLHNKNGTSIPHLIIAFAVLHFSYGCGEIVGLCKKTNNNSTDAKAEKLYKEKISEWLKATPNDIFLYWKGRVALFALLRAMGVGKDDEVILPAFTCVVVPNAIKYLGAKPVYVDIDIETYNANVDQIQASITKHTKVILCQNTFGFSSNLETITAIAQARGIYTIEDCTHGFGGTYNGKPNGTYCDAAFYSTQWNKPFSTGIGGFAYVKDKDLQFKMLEQNPQLTKPSFKDNISLPILYFIREKILTDKRYWRMVKFYRFLSKHKLVQGSSSGIEISSTKMPKKYFKGISMAQIKKGTQTIDLLEDALKLRAANSRRYTVILEDLGKNHVPESQFQNHSFLKYPLLVTNREGVMKIAEEERIPLGEWFCSPIHPVMDNWENWDFNGNRFPNGTRLAEEVIDLPTDTKDLHRVEQFILHIRTYILPDTSSASNLS